MERMGLNGRIVSDCLQTLSAAAPGWRELLETCFLSDGQKSLYRKLLDRRYESLAGSGRNV